MQTVRGIIQHQRLGTFGYFFNPPASWSVWLGIGRGRLLLGEVKQGGDGTFWGTLDSKLGVVPTTTGPHETEEGCIARMVERWKELTEARDARGGVA